MLPKPIRSCLHRDGKPSFSLRAASNGLTVLLALAMWSVPAHAQVKWFAPCIVDAASLPISETLTNIWFWLAIVLVMAFFLATRAIERATAGQSALDWFDRVSDPLWRRADDFMRVTSSSILPIPR
jgi:hypothetical protein